MSRGHECPVCRAPGVEYSKATCRPCWDQVPRQLRVRLTSAWAGRISDPRAHREALTALLDWAREYRAARHAPA